MKVLIQGATGDLYLGCDGSWVEGVAGARIFNNPAEAVSFASAAGITAYRLVYKLGGPGDEALGWGSLN